MSCTISSMAVPSLPEPAWPGSTVTVAGRSPEAWRAASESTPSDSTQTLVPAPVRPAPCAALALCAATPSQVALPALAMTPDLGRLFRRWRNFSGGSSWRLVVACSRGPTVRTSARLAMVFNSDTGTRAVTVSYCGNAEISEPPRARMKAVSASDTLPLMTTKMVWSGATF